MKAVQMVLTSTRMLKFVMIALSQGSPARVKLNLHLATVQTQKICKLTITLKKTSAMNRVHLPLFRPQTRNVSCAKPPALNAQINLIYVHLVLMDGTCTNRSASLHVLWLTSLLTLLKCARVLVNSIFHSLSQFLPL